MSGDLYVFDGPLKALVKADSSWLNRQWCFAPSKKVLTFSVEGCRSIRRAKVMHDP